MRLYDRQNRRLYINASERQRFLVAAKRFPPLQRTLCLTLLYTGCRLSEALALCPADIQLDARVITFRTLKQRGRQRMREVPIPRMLAKQLDHWHLISAASEARAPLWQRDGKPVTRVAAYRWIKEVMTEAEINGAQACPKGLRHGYGIHATLAGVQLHMLSKWMGHASLSTTQIYAEACGPEEREIAARMWNKSGNQGSVERSGRLSSGDLRLLARAYDMSVNNPLQSGEALPDLRQRLDIGSHTLKCFDNMRYFTVALDNEGFSLLLTIDRVAERIVSSADVTLRA